MTILHIPLPLDVVPHTFPDSLLYRGDVWDLSHLKPFAIRVELEPELHADVVVLFSCHCFTSSVARDLRKKHEIPSNEIFDDGRESRVLDPVRYRLSKNHLVPLVKSLPKQKIIVANDVQQNLMTWEILTADGESLIYAIFFELDKDRTRKRRLILRVQSAYHLEAGLSKRQKGAKKVGWLTLLRAAHEGRKIRP